MEVTGMRNRTKFTLSIIALALSTSSALAQEDDTGFFAKADTTIAHDDNIYRVTDDLALSDTYLSVAPKLQLIGGFGKQRFEIIYQGEYAKFSDADDANYADHDISGKIKLDHTLRFSTKFEAGYQKEHEEPGSINRVQLEITEYNKYDQNFFLAGLVFGQDNAIGKFSLDYRRVDRDQTNNDLEYLDFVSDQISARFTYRLFPKTRIYVEAIATEFDYKPGSTFELDNDFKRYRAGLTWDFTNKLTGDINIGYQDRNYAQDTLRDIDGLTYNGEVSWAINTYTTIAVDATRESVDSSVQNAGGSLRTTYGASIKHKLSELLAIKAEAGYANDELVFTSNRQDKRYAYAMGIEYDFSRNIDLAAEYIYEERDSSLDLADFKANILSISIKVSLED